MRHPDREAFVRAILASPDGDLPRHIYHDWLLENGFDGRARLIRVGCGLARLWHKMRGEDYARDLFAHLPVAIVDLTECYAKAYREWFEALDAARPEMSWGDDEVGRRLDRDYPMAPPEEEGVLWQPGGWVWWRGFPERFDATIPGPVAVELRRREPIFQGLGETYGTPRPFWRLRVPRCEAEEATSGVALVDAAG